MSPDFIEGNTVFQNIKRLKIHRPIRRLKSQIIRICLFFPEKKDDPEPPSPTPIKRFNIRQLTKQCGMTYRGSENTMLGTGRQPFLVVVKINFQKVCFGTLISPMHVLTLASCLMQPTVSTLDFLWCQWIKLIQVVSTSEFHEY